MFFLVVAFSSYCLFSVLILCVYSIFCVHYALHLPTLTLCLCDFFGRIVFCSVVRVPACLCDFSDASFDYMGASFDYICASFDYADAPFDCQRAALEHIGVVLTRLVSVHGSCSFTAVPRQAVPWNYPAIRVAALTRRLTFPARFLTASPRRLTTRTRRLTTPTRSFLKHCGLVQLVIMSNHLTGRAFFNCFHLYIPLMCSLCIFSALLLFLLHVCFFVEECVIVGICASIMFIL